MVSRESIPESVVPGLRYRTSPFNVEPEWVLYHKKQVHKTAASARAEQADTWGLSYQGSALNSKAKESNLGKF